MRHFFFFLGVIIAVVCQPVAGMAQAPAASEPSVRIIKVNFASLKEVVGLLEAVKSPDGKVAANEEARSVVLMDTPEKIRAMESMLRQIDLQTVTAEIPLKYSRADEVLDKVRHMLTKSVGVIAADTAGNKLVVTDTPVAVEKIRRAAEQLDPHGRKVIVEAKLVYVALDDEHLNGVDWSGIVEDYQNFHLSGKYSFLGGKESGETLSLGTIEDEDFVPLIEALDTVGAVKEFPVVDVPVMSEGEVQMAVRFDQPGVMLKPMDNADRLALPSESSVVEFVLRPQVDVDGTLKILISSLDPKVQSGKVPARSSFLTRNPHAAVVRSAQGGSVVLGGLIATGQVLVQRKVPLMGDIPLLGFAFKYHNSSIRREEFVVILTFKMAAGDEAITGSREAGKTL